MLSSHLLPETQAALALSIFFATFIGFWLYLNAVIVEQRKAD